MINKPTLEELERLPGLGDTRHLPYSEKPVSMHFFQPNNTLFPPSHVYLIEFDPQERKYMGFYQSFGNNSAISWGYFRYGKLLRTRYRIFGLWVDKPEIERDLDWRVKTVAEVREEINERVLAIKRDAARAMIQNHPWN